MLALFCGLISDRVIQPVGFERLRILVAQGESAVRQATVEFFATEGWGVRGAEDGHEALEIARGFQPGVLVTNWVLPGQVSGCALAESLRFAIPKIGLVFLTNLPIEKLQSPIAHFAPCVAVETPCTSAELVEVVRRMARQEPSP